MKIEEVVFGIRHGLYYFRRQFNGEFQEVFLDDPARVLEFADSVLDGADALIYGRTFEFPLPKGFHRFSSKMLKLLATRKYDKIDEVNKLASRNR